MSSGGSAIIVEKLQLPECFIRELRGNINDYVTNVGRNFPHNSVENGPMKKEKAWISFEIDKEMFDALCEHSERVTLTYELVIKELIRNVLDKTKIEHCEHLNENGSCDYPKYKCCDAWINWAGEIEQNIERTKEAEWFCKQSKEFRLKHGDIWMG